MERGQLVAGRYALGELLGEGGIGLVFEALDHRTGQRVALKGLRPEFARDARVRRRFVREARAVARLNHAHIVRLLDFGEGEDGSAFLAMELVRGRPLSELRDEGLELDELLSITDQVLAALAFAHARGVVHRDVKPENILVERVSGQRPQVKLLDFGFARIEDDQDIKLTQAQGDAFGTPLYMAPEQAAGKGSVGPATDLYAVGVILYECLSGAPPFSGAHAMAVALKHVMDPVPPLVPRFGLSVPLGLDAIVLRCLEKDPGRRPRNAAELRRLLGQFSPAEARDDEDGEGDGDATLALRGFEQSSPSDTALLPLQTPLARSPNRGTTKALQAGASDLAPEDAPLVGRDEELVWLWSRASIVCAEGTTQIAVIRSTAGMGRRRLVQWLMDQLSEGGWMFQVTLGAEPDASGETGLRALVSALCGGLASCAAAHTEASAPRDVEALRARVAALWGRHATEPGAPMETLTRDTLVCVVDLLSWVSRDRPVALVIDSLDRISADVVALLEHLAAWVELRPLPLLVVTGMTVDEAGSASDARAARLVAALERAAGGSVKTLTLPPLGAEALSRIVAPVGRLDAALAEALQRRTRGVPFFARELALYLLQTRELEVGPDGVIRVSRAGSPGAWPQTVADVLVARMELVVSTSRDPAAMLAAVESLTLLGDAFDYELATEFLRTLLPHGARVDGLLDVLIQAGVLCEARAAERDRLRYVHPLLRDALMPRLEARGDFRDRARIAADVYAEFARRDPAPWATTLASLYVRAGDVRAATRWAMTGAKFLQGLGRYAEAQAALEQVDALLERETAPDTLRLRAQGWLALGELDASRGEAARAGALTAQVLAWSRQRGEIELTARALLLMGDLLRAAGQSAEASAAYSEAEAIFDDFGDAHGRARCLLGRGLVERAVGRAEEAFACFEGARTAMERSGDTLGVARALRGQGEIYLRKGEAVSARDRLERARQAYEGGGDPAGLAFTEWLLGETYRLLGMSAQAVQLFEASLARSASLGDAPARGRAALSLARARREAGEWLEAEAYFEQACNAFERAGDAARELVATLELGFGAACLRRFEVAERRLGRAQALATGDRTLLPGQSASVLAVLAWIGAERGDDARADALLHEAWALDAAHGVVEVDYARGLLGAAEVDLHLGRTDRAVVLLERAAQVFEALGLAVEASRARELAFSGALP